jgi:hypothetical protein
LRVVPLSPVRQDAISFEALAGRGSFATSSNPAIQKPGNANHPFRSPLPSRQLLVASALVVLLAAYTVWVSRLRTSTSPARNQ